MTAPLTPRQAQFTDAALSLLTRDGLGSVSFRTVAAEAGMSLGAVQKAFPSKDALLAAMLQRMRETAAAPALGEPGRPTLRSWLVGLLLATLPLDEERRNAQVRASGFAERAAYDPAIAAVIAAGDRALIGRLTALIRRAVAEGEVPAQTDPDAVAHAWLALAQGLASQLLYDPRDEDDVRRLADLAIGRLLGL